MSTADKPLREAMLYTAEIIDAHREYFGVEATVAAVRRGLAGEPWFFASENRREMGARIFLQGGGER